MGFLNNPMVAAPANSMKTTEMMRMMKSIVQ
jgi:hypothetical protein